MMNLDTEKRRLIIQATIWLMKKYGPYGWKMQDLFTALNGRVSSSYIKTFAGKVDLTNLCLGRIKTLNLSKMTNEALIMMALSAEKERLARELTKNKLATYGSPLINQNGV